MMKKHVNLNEKKRIKRRIDLRSTVLHLPRDAESMPCARFSLHQPLEAAEILAAAPGTKGITLVGSDRSIEAVQRPRENQSC